MGVGVGGNANPTPNILHPNVNRYNLEYMKKTKLGKKLASARVWVF